MFKITICPSCGSDRLKMLRDNWTGKFKNRTYIVPMLEFYECADCGEKIYDAQAMRKIETYSPCFVRKRQYKISA